MSLEILINEVYPNPESDSEWIEFLVKGEIDENSNLNNYTIFDNYHQIYKFTNEKFIDQILVVEVSSLNNDRDSVVLKDPSSVILDSFSYSETQKGLSWSRNLENEKFILSEPSKNLANPIVAKEVTATPTISPTIYVTPSTTPTKVAENQNLSISPTIHTQKTENSSQKSRKQYKYDLNNVKLLTEEKVFAERKNRLVILSKTQGQAEILNAIIGSSLIILSSLFLIYVKIKGKRR